MPAVPFFHFRRAPRGVRLARDAGLFALLLLLWVVSYSLLTGRTGLLWFSERPPVAELVESAGNGLQVPDGGRERQRISLGAVAVEPGGRYLLRVWASEGSEFQIFGLDARGAAALRRTIPGRAGAGDAVVFFRGGAESANLRIQIVHQRPGEFRITRAALYRVRAGLSAAKAATGAIGPLLLAAFLWRHRRRLSGALREPDRVAEGVFSGLVLAICLWAFTNADVEQILDSKFTTAVSQSLLERGTVALPSAFSPARYPKAYQLVRVGDDWFHFSASATAILDTPFVALHRLFGIRSVSADGSFLRHQEARILAPIAALLAAVLCVVFYNLARLFLAPLPALLATGVTAFGTQVFSTLSRPYWTHSWAVLLLTLALYLVLSPRLNRQAASDVAAATLLSWAVACRPICALSAAAVTALVLIEKKRFPSLLVATGIGWLGLFLLGSYIAFGSPLPPYLTVHAGLFAAEGRSLTEFVSAALGTLVSPARGLLLFVPISAWALWETGRQWRHLPSRPLAGVSLATFAAHWLVISTFRLWWGGQSFGPRLLVDALPWLFLLGVLAVSARGAGEALPRWSASSVRVLILIAALSIFVNARGATSNATWSWRSYDRPPRRTNPWLQPAWAWNWRYPQFTAGLLPADAPGESPPAAGEPGDGELDE
jgi:hypothetical protein